MSIKHPRLVGNTILWVVAAIWGSSYVLMKMVTNAQMPAGMINGWRGLIAASFVGLIFFKKLRHMSAHDVKVCFLNFNHRAQAAQDLLNQGAGRFNHLLR